MPFFTKNYRLTAFTWNEIYSASEDASRFTIIDNQLAFISDQIENGVIRGWEIIDNGDGTATVSPGMGMIGRRIIETNGELLISLTGNTVHYIHMREKEGYVGGISGNSNVVNVLAVDVVPPSAPSGVSQVSDILIYLASLSEYDSNLILYLKNLMKIFENNDNLELIDYSQIAFRWDYNTEADISYYIIKRAENLEYGVYEEILRTQYNVFIDSDLEQNTSYTYQIIAVDLSGNESSITEFSLSTEIDTRIPSNPVYVQVFPSNESIEVLWNNSPSSNVSSYRISVQPLDDFYNPYGTSIEKVVDTDESFGSSYVIFKGLENNKKYEVTVYSVTPSLIESEGISVNTEIFYLPGAGEIDSVEASFPLSEYDGVGIEAHLLWTYSQEDPYLDYAERFIITFVENGTRFSEPIEVRETLSLRSGCVDTSGSCYGAEIRYLPYNLNGEIIYESIKEYTPYFIIVQTADEDGNISNGFIKRISRTPVSDTVSAITNFSIQRKNNNSVLLAWDNPVEEYFLYNTISIRIVNLAESEFNPSSFDEERYIIDKRIDKSNTYLIPSSKFNINYRYHIEIKSYDVFNTEGGSYETYHQFLGEDEKLYPDSPIEVAAEGGDTMIHLGWRYDYENNVDVEYFNIYRATFSFYLEASDFSLLSTVPSSFTTFTDYFVENGDKFTYYVTATDVYGNESTRISSGSYMPTTVVSATASQKSTLSPPENLLVTRSGYDAILQWDAGTGTFDGYEILRSDKNKYSFRVVGYVPVSFTTYTDEDALLENEETYYYVVRKYCNDTNVYVDTSENVSDSFVLIGKITTTNGLSNVLIDQTVARNLLNFEDPIKERTQEKIASHHHIYDEVSGIDKRIELRSNVVITTWETMDYQTYTTDQDIEGASSYIINISAEVNEEYFKDSNGKLDTARYQASLLGESPVIYEIDSENNRIVFNEALYTTCVELNEDTTGNTCPVMPYSTEPSISLELMNISEVDNYLQNDNLGTFSATQIETGKINASQLPSVHHEGRIGEKLIPIRLPMKSDDKYTYTLTKTYDGDRNKMGTSVTFYDIIEGINDGELVAASSRGILYSENDGSDWIETTSLPSAPRRIFKSSNNTYYAILSNAVYKLKNTNYQSWEAMSGLDFVKSIRDIIEDLNGNLYISTDMGVYKLNSDLIPYIEDSWQQLPIFGARSSDAFALFFDENYSDSTTTEGRIIVSNELGIIQSTDNGLSWEYSSELDSNVKIRKFQLSNGYIFGLSDNALYRKDVLGGNFIKVADTNSGRCRSMEVYNGKIYISSDTGPLVSVSSDIYVDANFDFIHVWSEINKNNQIVIVTSINNIGEYLFIGTDRVLYIYDGSKIWKQYINESSVVPTFLIDNEVQQLGFYYINKDIQNVSFEEALGVESYAYVSNMYDLYYSEYGGWASNKFDAKVNIYKNNMYFGETEDEVIINTYNFSNKELPSYTDLNAHKAKADEYKLKIEEDVYTLVSQYATLPDLDIRNLITSIYLDYELFLSQLYDDIKSDFVLPEISVEVILKRVSVNNQGQSIYVEIPVYNDINETTKSNYHAYINVVSGLFQFDMPFDRYDILSVDIFGTTIANSGEYDHRGLEDIFEDAYSGFTSYLSQVQQINLLKLGIFSEQTWEGAQNIYAPLTYSRSIIPSSNMEYDSLNSTVNYTEESSNGDDGFAILYPSVVRFIDFIDKVFVGGWEGMLSVDVNTLNIQEVEVGDFSGKMVRDIFSDGENIFVLTDSDIFHSQDGQVWTEYDKSGLSNRIYAMGRVNNNYVVGGSDGVYLKSSQSGSNWERVIESSSPVEIIISSNVLFTIINGVIHVTSNGYSYSSLNVGSNMDISGLARYGYISMYVSSNQGLYSDNGSFNGVSPILRVIEFGDAIDADVVVNCVDANGDKTVFGFSNGSYGVIEGGEVQIKEYSSLKTVHKCIIVNGDIWLFGADRFKVPDLDYPIRLSTGLPL